MKTPPALPEDAAKRISLMEDSLRAYVCSWVGLIPVLGIPFAMTAFVIGWRVRLREKATPNPARRYRLAAVVLGGFGMICWVSVAAWVVVRWCGPMVESLV